MENAKSVNSSRTTITELMIPKTGEDVYYSFIPDYENAEKFVNGQTYLQFDTGKGVAAYGKNSTRTKGTFYIGLYNDNQIQVSEVQQVSYLDVSFSSIDNLSGVENFTNLLYLKIDNNYLTSIEVSSLINLIHLSCTNNSLTSLNVSTLTNLEDLKIL